MIPIDFRDFFRDHWATRMTDSCVVKVETGRTFDEGSGKYTPTYNTVYSGDCLVRPRSAADASRGEALTVVFDFVVFIPWDEVGPAPEHLIDISSGTDPRLNGTSGILRGVEMDTYNHRRMLLVEHLQRAA